MLKKKKSGKTRAFVSVEAALRRGGPVSNDDNGKSALHAALLVNSSSASNLPALVTLCPVLYFPMLEEVVWLPLPGAVVLYFAMLGGEVVVVRLPQRPRSRMVVQVDDAPRLPLAAQQCAVGTRVELRVRRLPREAQHRLQTQRVHGQDWSTTVNKKQCCKAPWV